MKNQPDFLAQREWLREVVEEAGCQIMYVQAIRHKLCAYHPVH